MGPVWRLWRSFQWCRELLQRNARVKATLETYICWCPFGSDIRKNARRDTIECQNRDTTVEIQLTRVEKKGPQLALEPLNGRSIAGYVLKP